MGDDGSPNGHADAGIRRTSIAERRAALVAHCAQALPGAMVASSGAIHVPMSVVEFERALRARFAATHPQLVYRTESTLERARLQRSGLEHIPRVMLRQGAPRRS
jgi:hypothetical protein